MHAVRVAVTGKAVGFGLFDTLAILGRERCLARIDRAFELAARSACRDFFCKSPPASSPTLVLEKVVATCFTFAPHNGYIRRLDRDRHRLARRTWAIRTRHRIPFLLLSMSRSPSDSNRLEETLESRTVVFVGRSTRIAYAWT